MTYTSDQQLAALGLRPMRDIPNRDGYALTLRTRDGVDVPAVVRKSQMTQTHSVTPTDLRDAVAYRFNGFIGWRPRVEPGNTLITHKAGPNVIDAHLQARRARLKT